MIRPEGRAIAGLDEFMLRLGHLSVISHLVARHGGSRERLARSLVKYLTKSMPVAVSARSQLAVYLYAKHLSAVRDSAGSSSAARAKARYPKLTVVLDDNRVPRDLEAVDAGEGPEVWLQDFFLSRESLPSRIGAVTIDAEAFGSKTGVSHLLDWSQLTGLVNTRWSLTAIGRAVNALSFRTTVSNEELEEGHNPYELGPERLALGWAVFNHDADVLFRLMARLNTASSVNKQAAVEIVGEVAHELLSDLRALGGHANMRVTRAVKDFCADVIGGPEQRSRSGGSAWHRVSSRLETLTDLGFLSKDGIDGSRRDFEYYYRPTPLMAVACREIEAHDNAIDWLDGALAGLLFPAASTRVSDGDLCAAMAEAWNMNAGPTGVHIDALSVTTASIACWNGMVVSVADVRRRMGDLALSRGDIFSVTRGYSGTRAELATGRSSDLQRLGSSAFALP